MYREGEQYEDVTHVHGWCKITSLRSSLKEWFSLPTCALSLSHVLYCTVWMSLCTTYCTVQCGCHSVPRTVLYRVDVTLYHVLYCTVWMSLCTTYCTVQSGCHSVPRTVLYSVDVTLYHVLYCTVWMSLCTMCSTVQYTQLTLSVSLHNMYNLGFLGPGFMVIHPFLMALMIFDICREQTRQLSLVEYHLKHGYTTCTNIHWAKSSLSDSPILKVQNSSLLLVY